MKKLFILLSSSILLAAFAACGDDNNEPNQPVTPPDPDPIVDKTPVYETITTDIVVEEYSTYADEWKTIFPKKSVINTNPDTIVADSILARMSKEENERLDKMSSDETYVGEIAMELNGHRLECTAFYYYYPEYNYLPKTRIELINNYCKSNFLSLATNFSDVPDYIAVRPRTREPYYTSIWQGKNQGGSDYVPASYFKTIDEVPDVASVTYLPEIYRLVYDRFNDREYEGFDLMNQQVTTDRFKTIVKPGKITDIEGYERPKKIPEGWEEYFNPNKTYGIVYIYKNEEFLCAGIIDKYDEEWSEEGDSIYYICNFRAFTGLNGNVVEIDYEWPGNSCFHIRELDFTQPTEYAEFTEIRNEYYYTNNDFKEGHPMTFGYRELKTNLIEE